MKKIYIEPSSLCNLNCAMCFRNGWINEQQDLMDSMTFDCLFASLCKNVPERVTFGGMGEPLLHPQLPVWISRLHEIGCRTELITNGTLLDSPLSQELLSAGVSKVWISMDGFSGYSYKNARNGAIYDQLVTNILGYNCARRECGHGELGITFVVTNENIAELACINTFADQYCVDSINLSHAVPMAPISREDVLLWDSIPVGEMRRYCSSSTKRQIDHCRFISEENCFVRWDGEVAPCMQLLHEHHTWFYKEERRVHRLSFGNVRERPLFEIWSSDAYSQFRKRVMEFDFPSCIYCDGCDYRLSNETDCAYNTFPTCGACFWAQGVIFCP